MIVDDKDALRGVPGLLAAPPNAFTAWSRYQLKIVNEMMIAYPDFGARRSWLHHNKSSRAPISRLHDNHFWRRKLLGMLSLTSMPLTRLRVGTVIKIGFAPVAGKANAQQFIFGRLRKTFGPGVPTGRADVRDAVTGELKGSRQIIAELLFDSNPIPMWLMDVKIAQNPCAVNDAAVKHYGYTREKFLTVTALDIRLPEGSR